MNGWEWLGGAGGCRDVLGVGVGTRWVGAVVVGGTRGGSGRGGGGGGGRGGRGGGGVMVTVTDNNEGHVH